ncbi:MAG: tetratricopeptide repeat protein [Treponema sp.]|jgi:tetratricopeptide (TPR) repeat protein|nr:tetratricopeptide repeat protein [Treponema sp.]
MKSKSKSTIKKIKDFFVAIIILFLVGMLIYYLYNRTASRSSRELTRQMAEISPRGGPPETIEGLRQAIVLYEEQIERHVREAAQTGVYWKILGTRLADRNMHNHALEAFEKAIYYNTNDASLYYMAGISAGYVAKSIVDSSVSAEMERDRLFQYAENSHLRALELDNTYTQPMYALGVLYAFELDNPDDAIDQLERYMQIRPSDIHPLFVLARAYFMKENLLKTIELYDTIIDRTRDQNVRREAQELRDMVQGIRYE